MINAGKQLDVNTQAAVHVTPRLSNKSHCEFTLEHEDSASEHRTMLQ